MSTNLIDIINEKNRTSAYDVFLPSLKQNIKFKPLTIEQFKCVVDSATKVPYLNVGFQQELNNIIKNNIISDDQNIFDSITEIDKLVIAINIRINDVSQTYRDKNILFKKDDILNLLLPDKITLKNESILIECSVPKITVEEKYNNYVTTKFNETISEESAIKDIFNLMLIAEAAKYIDNITIDGISYDRLEPYDEWVKIVAALPLLQFSNIINYIDNIKSLRDNLLRIDDSTFIEYDMNIFTSI
jgi:hypothetical protein